MAVPDGLSRILTETTPGKITDVVEKILDILNKINTAVRKINEIDFCNPLGYILTKALPPGGILEGKLLKFGKGIMDFTDKIENKLDPFKGKDETEEAYKTRLQSYQTSIEEIRVALEDIIPPPELVEIIPGGEGLIKTINSLNLVLTKTSDTLDARVDPKQLIINQISFLKAFTSKLKPFTSPINIANLAIGDKAEELNKKLRGFIKPERFAKDLKQIINGVKSIDRAIKQIQSLVSLINKIIKVINVLIKIFKFIIKIITKLAIPSSVPPGVGVPLAVPNTFAYRISKTNTQLEDLEKVLKMVSGFLDVSVLLEIQRIRREILRLITGLNLLYKNITACPYINDDLLKQSLQDGISSLQDNLDTLDILFPGAKYSETTLPKQYSGYQIDIIKEEIVDIGITLIRRRVVVADQRGIIQYEGTPTYAPDDQVLIKEGQYYIDRQFQRSTSADDNDNISDQEIIDIVTATGLNPDNTIIGTVTPSSPPPPQEQSQFQLQGGDTPGGDGRTRIGFVRR